MMKINDDERVSLLRSFTGFSTVIILMIMFSFSFVAVTKEVSKIQTINTTFAERIIIDDFTLQTNSYIYDANGEVVSEVYSSEHRIYLPFSKIPNHFIEAVIATEDRHFYSHKGFDMTGITRALFVNAENDTIQQGGSTITQQLVKNLFLNNERTYNRKLVELLYAYQFERTFSKEEVLEFYLNTIYFQNGVYGIEAASQFYFSRPASDLSLAEVAFLSAIPNNPSLYNPLKNLDNTNERKKWILTKMLEIKFINDEEYSQAINSEIQLLIAKKIDLYPDYVTYIHDEFEQLIGEKEGFNQKIAEATSIEEQRALIRLRKQRAEYLLSSGVHIYTALQPKKQRQMYHAMEQYLPEESIQAAAVMINEQQQIIALIGGKNYHKFDFLRATQAFRQPGSAIKPLLVYAPYLAEENVSTKSMISAAPFCKNGYCPQNFAGASYGNVAIETAFKHSYNTAAARMLDIISIEKGFSYFEKLGFSMIVHEDYRLPASLGGLTYGVSPLELTNAYSTFANDGKFLKARAITKVNDGDGNLLFQWDEKEQVVWDNETNLKMRSLLNKVVTEGTGRKAYFNSSFIGGKTGTTNNFHDLWFIGLNESYTTGVWVGYDQPQSLEAISSRAPHLFIWKDIMRD